MSTTEIMTAAAASFDTGWHAEQPVLPIGTDAVSQEEQAAAGIAVGVLQSWVEQKVASVHDGPARGHLQDNLLPNIPDSSLASYLHGNHAPVHSDYTVIRSEPPGETTPYTPTHAILAAEARYFASGWDDGRHTSQPPIDSLSEAEQRVAVKAGDSFRFFLNGVVADYCTRKGIARERWPALDYARPADAISEYMITLIGPITHQLFDDQEDLTEAEDLARLSRFVRP